MSTLKTIVRFIEDVLTYTLLAPIVLLFWLATAPARYARGRRAAERDRKIRQLEDDIAELKRKKQTWETRRRQFEQNAAHAKLSPWSSPEYRMMNNTIDALESQIHDLNLQLAPRK